MAKELGTVLSVLLTFAIMAIIYAFTFLSWYLQTLAFVFIVLCINKSRRDIDFLSTTLGHKTVWRVLMLDNVFLSVPFIVLNLSRGNVIIALLIMGIALLATLFRNSTPHLIRPTRTLLQMGGIDYEKGFRESIAIFVLAIALVIIGICYENLNLAKTATIFYFIVYASAFPNVIVRHDYMMCNSSIKHLCIMRIINTLAYTAILGLPFIVLHTLKWHLQSTYFCGILYLVTCLSSVEMSLLRYHIKGNVILTIVSLIVLLFLCMATLMKPLLLLVYVAAIMITFLSTLSKIKENIYGCY